MSSAEHPQRIALGAIPYWEAEIRKHLAPRYTPSFVDLSQTRLTSFDAVIPMALMDYPQLRRTPSLLGRRCFYPSVEVVALCDDKQRFAQHLAQQGFGGNVPALRECGPPYPYVWKKRNGWWGSHCHIVRSEADESQLDLNDPEWFAQTLVSGEIEFATHILRVGGAILYQSTFAHTMSAPTVVKGSQGQALHSSFHRGCLFQDTFAAILDSLDYEGTACFDYKVTNGKPAIFELNPRFGGSLCADITAYVDAYLGALQPLTLGRRALYELQRLRP